MIRTLINIWKPLPKIYLLSSLLVIQSCEQASEQENLAEYAGSEYSEEARDSIEIVAYDQAKEEDTIEGYKEFLGRSNGYYEDIEKRLGQLLYERAEQTGTLEDWIAFHNKYCYRTWSDNDKSFEPMIAHANTEIERLLYERIITVPSLDQCSYYLRNYPDGPHRQQVKIKAEPCLFDYAVQMNTIEIYLVYLTSYTEGFRDGEIRKRLESLMFAKLDVNEDFKNFERYLSLYPKEKTNIIGIMEPSLFDWVQSINTVESYEKYFEIYPKGPHLKEALAGLDSVLFKRAQEVDWYSFYEYFIMRCPDGENAHKAKDRIIWLKKQKAIPVIEFPTFGGDGTYWSWNTIFKEVGGKIGYKVWGKGYIQDTAGNRWGISERSELAREFVRGSVITTAGGTVQDNFRCNHNNHDLCNGYAIFTWEGEDAGGHPIKLEEKVQLRDTDCLRYNKEE